ncbi:DNA mismatch repair protein MutL [Drepanopeziza brunnea f. sp. 'multigermtubi' MB_m1]|uniref:DNA mismatch repair protein PMS1 n=1 Tax=Marssonina brunnea f. sp. multigermtubi (strain MB_m1) TaxID=1072389 RepID=K1WYU6_MARBU|nr:DNA mismatch repair protein MutL [Drepanopeziza brunnea f. sp. 'multigermtubi' MB_m1]EKD17782.1 DNA mismatch repair protein MutL [Drepanopeziza brunnea f. sp. 'multigermtubi' MB_m1]
MATIKAIEGKTVHQIQSGQVIVDLCSVVKELVENSLDAGATSIDVRFRNQGLDSIEVQDNGDGISPHNYETLALKHHTSKLSTYSDLTTLQTFGFRGEALSSLCALSRFSVVTCMAADAPKGTKLDFEVSGMLKGTGVVAAQKGTLVSVENLFNNLPVRRRELERNIKREWTRVMGVLGQYACIQTGIKFSVSQQAGKGKKTTLFSTKGNQSTRENIVNVFGAKTLTALIPLDLNLELDATSAPSQKWSTQDDGDTKKIRITGHVSRPASGEGRQTPDRQMFFVNARPCGLPQVAKAFNEVYKAYNGTQSPFIFANIELDTHLYDVNVSPDKRTILLHDQNRMLENLKEELTKLFESQDYTVPISQLPAQKQLAYKQLTISRENSTISPRTSQSPAVIAEREESEDAGSVQSSSRRGQSVDDETPSKKSNPQPRGAVSRDSMGRDSSAANLISKWAGRRSEDRIGKEKEDPALPKKAVSAPPGLSEEKRRLLAKLRNQSEQEQGEAVPESSAESDISAAGTQSLSDLASNMEPPPPVPIFSKGTSEAPTISSSVWNDSRSISRSVEPERDIPALGSPPKPTPSIADRFSSTARTQRAPGEIATITIGDHTVTSTIGYPAKRARIENLSSSAPSSRRSQAQTAKGPLPTFGSSLSQMFAASGTTTRSVVADDIEDGSDSEVANAAPASPQTDSPEADGPMDIPDDDGEGLFVPQTPRPKIDSVKQQDPDLDSSIPPHHNDEEDAEYIDEVQKKALEEAKVQEIIDQAEKSGVQPSQETTLRAKSLLKGGSRKKDATLNLVRVVETDISKIAAEHQALNRALSEYQVAVTEKAKDEALDSAQAEEKLSLIISKSDFAKMKIVGQFNLGFILATRASGSKCEDGVMTADDMFIIDQHASDEKYNFERLYATTIVQSQRLVYPKTLDLTALEEEIVMENLSALETNGFIITVDETGESPVGKRCQLTSLPISRETAFSLTDLEELIALLAEYSPGTGPVPRPSKMRKMFAMRACRSSIMIGKTLTGRQMGKVVRHLGELDKPWNCPHGRPTMRHLCALGEWDGVGWREGDVVDEDGGVVRGGTDWAGYLREQMEEVEMEEEHDFEMPDATQLGEEEHEEYTDDQDAQEGSEGEVEGEED